tara:strand:+ start:22405 stop:22710 length:306 start_codon:yes stop_codon:yes gene_type:complete
MYMAHDFSTLPNLSEIPDPQNGGQWDSEALTDLWLCTHMAAKVGAYPVAHDTGDGWVFGWDVDNNPEDPTASLAPIMSEDWWPGPERVTPSELEILGFTLV